MNDSRDFQDAESARRGLSHVPSQPAFFPPHPDPGGMLSRSLGMPSRKNGPPTIWDTHGISGNVFANPTASSSAPYPQELNPWSSQKSEKIHSSQAAIQEHPFLSLITVSRTRTISVGYSTLVSSSSSNSVCTNAHRMSRVTNNHALQACALFCQLTSEG